jgi:hypothetical protein
MSAHLIARLTQPGDVVIDLDGHPTITAAAGHLGRQAPPLVNDGSRPKVRRASDHRQDVALLLL